MLPEPGPGAQAPGAAAAQLTAWRAGTRSPMEPRPAPPDSGAPRHRNWNGLSSSCQKNGEDQQAATSPEDGVGKSSNVVEETSLLTCDNNNGVEMRPNHREVATDITTRTVGKGWAGERRPPWFERRLLTYHDVPRYLQFNPYIVRGYRPLSTFWGSIRSLFYLHNETFNILTHGVPIVYILLMLPGALPWDQLDGQGRFLAWCHLIGSVAPWIGSFTYHLFMNLRSGERVYRGLLKLDMLGIWICQSFGALPMISATMYCYPLTVQWVVISAYSILCLCGLYKAMTAWSPWDRRLSFTLPWLSRFGLYALRATLGGGSPDNMLHLILQDTISCVGGVIGAVYFPEKYFPGWMDYCLNSHNIMHVMTLVAVYSMHCATMQDLGWMASADCHPASPAPAPLDRSDL